MRELVERHQVWVLKLLSGFFPQPCARLVCQTKKLLVLVRVLMMRYLHLQQQSSLP
jgi:hypothetical protein